MPNVYETTDAADSSLTTYTLQLGAILQGSLAGGDHDFYRVNLTAGQTYSFAMVGTGVNNANDTYLRLYASDGTTQLAFNDDGLQSRNSVITFVATSTGHSISMPPATALPRPVSHEWLSRIFRHPDGRRCY